MSESWKVTLALVVTVLASVTCTDFNENWEIAVATNNHIELLSDDGSSLGTTMDSYNHLKAISYDDSRNAFFVGSREDEKDFIYNVELRKRGEVHVRSVVSNLPDDVQGISVDLIKNVLYWTDSILKTISYRNLDDLKNENKLYQQFSEEAPQDIAIDSCSRILYWTNRNFDKATIESIDLSTNERKVIVDTDLHFPHGIAIDPETQKIFWVDMRHGIYFRVESVNFDGSERQVVFEGINQQPFGIGINEKYIFWTDISNNNLWKIDRNTTNPSPIKLRSFSEKPFGLVVKFSSGSVSHRCPSTIPEISSTETAEVTSDSTEKITPSVAEHTKETIVCLNGGQINSASNSCSCPRGLSGSNCERKACDNFCLNGDCFLSSLGVSQCKCAQGFAGSRCEKNLCYNFCLNDGSCRISTPQSNSSLSTAMPVAYCECQEGFSGQRCSNNMNLEPMCNKFCLEKESGYVSDDYEKLNCRCDDEQRSNVHSNFSSSMLMSRRELMDKLSDPVFLVMAAVLLALIVTVSTLSMTICKLRRRPRIKKRIIVNKSITPLTYTPHQSQQCEITIENCCNMNICETPCFEPVASTPTIRGFQNVKKDEKKVLLTHMDGEEAMY